MQEENEKPINFTQWATDFCNNLINQNSEVMLFAAQLDTYIEQILETCELNSPNQESTTDFLEKSIPSIIDAIFNNGKTISNSEIKQAFIFIISNLTVLFQWIFSSDYFQLYHYFFPVFNEKSQIYAQNNGGQKPSKLWCDSMKKFIELSTFQILILRFEEENVQIDHFYTCFQVFSYLMPALDIQPSIELEGQLFQYFQTFLNEITSQNFGERIINTELLINSMEVLSRIMSILHDKTAFLNGINSYIHLLHVLVEINNEKSYQLAVNLATFLINFESEEANEQIKHFLLESNLFQKTQNITSSILKLIINDIKKKDLMKYLLSLTSYENIPNSMIYFERKKTKKFISKIPKGNTKLVPLLIDTALLAAETNPKLTKTILKNSFDQLDLSSVNESKFSPLYDKFQSDLTDICLSHINEKDDDVNLPLILKIFCEIVKKKPNILTDDILNIVYLHIIEKGNTALYPILDKAFVNSRRVMDKNHVEMLIKSSDHKQVWALFNNMVKARGVSAFDYDLSTSIFYNFEKENTSNIITKDDLSDPSYIDLVFNYMIIQNMKSKTLLTFSKSSLTSNTQNKSSTSPVTWISNNYTVVNWPLLYFDYLLQLVIFNESEMNRKNKENQETQQTQKINPMINNINHTEIYKTFFNMIKKVEIKLMKPVIETFIEILSNQTQNESFFVVLTFIYEFVQNAENSKCLKDYGIIQHYAINVPIESDLPNEVTVTYEKDSKTVRYDPQLPLSELLRSAALKFGSTKESLVLRNQDNKMLSNQILPNPDPSGYKMTGRLKPINYDEFPSCILSEDDISFSSYLLTKLMDDVPAETANLMQSFLEYLPTDSQIQNLVFNVDELIESLKGQNKPYLYFYLIKAAIHRSKSKELVSNYSKSEIFSVVKSDYLNARFDHVNDSLFLTFLCCFFNDKQVDVNMIKCLVDEIRGITNNFGDSKRTMELLNLYAETSKLIEIDLHNNPLADYLIENNLVEPLITSTNDNIKLSIGRFISFLIPKDYIYNLFLNDPKNSKIDEIFLSIFPEFIKEKGEKEKDEIITDLIDKFSLFNEQILRSCLHTLLNKEIAKPEYIKEMFNASMFIGKEPHTSNTLNTIVDFCMGELNQNQPNQQQQTNENYSVIVPDTEFKKCAYDFLESITKIHFVGNDLYIANPIRSNIEYVRQELFHLKPIRDCLLNPENHDYFVGNETAHDLQKYFSNMIIDKPPQFKYVKFNTLSPYKLLVNVISKVFPPEMRDKLLTIVPSQCIVDTSLFDSLEKATPSIIVHLTHYTPSSIPLEIKVKDENYNLTGIIVKQKSFNDQTIINAMSSQNGEDISEHLIPQKHVYRAIVLEGGSWLTYQDQFISRIDEERLYPIFQAEFESYDENSLKPYILFYTKNNIIEQFTIDFNQSPIIKYGMLHFQKREELPQDVLDEIQKDHHKSAIENFAISNAASSLFEKRADPSLMFTYFVNIYCRSSKNYYSNQFRNKLLLNGGINLPSLDLIISLIDPICESFKQMTQLFFIDTLALTISRAIEKNVTPDSENKENMKNYEKVLKIIEKISEVFPQLQYNFDTQNKVSQIFHSFILSTNTFLKDDFNTEKEDQSDIDSYSVCLSLNIPSMLFDSISINFSKTRSVNYISSIDANEILSCLTCFVEMLGDSLHDLLVHVSQIQQSNANYFYLLILLMKCIKYEAFTLDELKAVLNDPNNFLSNLNVTSALINGVSTSFTTDKEFAELSDIFYSDNILIYFLDRLILSINGNKSLMQKLIQISSSFFLNLFIYDNKQVRNKAYMLAIKLIDGEDNFTDYTIKIADNFNSELSLLLINNIITTTICDHQLIAQHLLKRAENINFIKEDKNEARDGIDEVVDSTDIFANVADDTEEFDDDNKVSYDYVNAFFKVLENLSIKNVDQYIPLIIQKLANVDNLRFFIKNFDQTILSEFEKNEEFVIPRISIYKHSLNTSSTTVESKSIRSKLSKLEGYELVSEFINCILGINPQSTIIKKIIINDKRGYVPYEFVRFIPAISTATDENEIETYLPPKILFKSLNYSIAKANNTETGDKNANCLVAVEYFLNILVKHSKEINFSRLYLNIPEICQFTSKFGNTKISSDLMKLIKIVFKQNRTFKEMLSDEIETQLKRSSEVPNLDVMKMEIELNLDYENVKNNIDHVADKIVEIHKAAVQRSLSRSPSSELSTPPKLDTSEYLFNFYLSEHFEQTPIAFMIFPVSLLSSKVEKKFFSSALADLSDDDYLNFVKNSIKSSKTLTQITFDQLDMKRIWFLLKLRPNLAEKIKKMIPVDRRRVIMMLKLMPDNQKYAMKVFDIKDEEIGINNNANADANVNVNATPSGIQRESVSVPNLNQPQNQRPPPPSANTSDNSGTSSRPYFFQRPKMPKKP